MSYNASSISNPNRKRKSGFTFSADWIVIVLFVALLFLGWLSVCGATHEFGDTNFLDWSSRSGKQLVCRTIEDAETGIAYVTAWNKNTQNPAAALFISTVQKFAEDEDNVYGI